MLPRVPNVLKLLVTNTSLPLPSDILHWMKTGSYLLAPRVKWPFFCFKSKYGVLLKLGRGEFDGSPSALSVSPASGFPNPNLNDLCCYNNGVSHLFERLGPTPHQTVFLELRGANLLCLKARDMRTTVYW